MPALWMIGLAVVGLPATIYLFVLVHHSLDRLIVRHVRGYCRKKGLRISRIRWMPAFSSGVKTEFTLVQADCCDIQNQRKLMDFLVSPFGVRKVLSCDEDTNTIEQKWPQEKPEGGYIKKRLR